MDIACPEVFTGSVIKYEKGIPAWSWETIKLLLPRHNARSTVKSYNEGDLRKIILGPEGLRWVENVSPPPRQEKSGATQNPYYGSDEEVEAFHRHF